MRIYMQIPPEGDKVPRYYHLHLQEDLLEGWTLIREWGYQGMAGRVKREHFADHEAAESSSSRQHIPETKREKHA
jgi:predicted DNA-binding WGR domain protein